jgi:hypothetical protein
LVDQGSRTRRRAEVDRHNSDAAGTETVPRSSPS